MSADLLREAVALMRERAEAADATGVWRGDDTDKTTAASGAFTHHVATFAQPAVALAVAGWLEKAAEHMDPELALDGGCFGCEEDGALVVARAYLGRDA